MKVELLKMDFINPRFAKSLLATGVIKFSFGEGDSSEEIISRHWRILRSKNERIFVDSPHVSWHEGECFKTESCIDLDLLTRAKVDLVLIRAFTTKKTRKEEWLQGERGEAKEERRTFVMDKQDEPLM